MMLLWQFGPEFSARNTSCLSSDDARLARATRAFRVLPVPETLLSGAGELQDRIACVGMRLSVCVCVCV